MATRSGDYFYDPPEVAELVPTLKGGTDWYTIGLKLSVPTYELDHIKNSGRSYTEQKEAMFRSWLSTMREEEKTPTWKMYQDVLEEIGLTRPLKIVKDRYRPGESKPSEEANKRPPLPKLGSRPTRKHLECLLGTNEVTYRTIQSVAHKWDSIAYQLELPQSYVKTLNKDLRDSEEKCIRVFEKWMDGGYRTPVTWATLLDVFNDLELSEHASDLEDFALSK